MNIYQSIANLAKSTKYQNLFLAAKEINGVNLFNNNLDFSKIQELFLCYLYNFDIINKDIITDKISKHVLDDEIYWESYMLWRKDFKYKKGKQQDSKSNLHLVTSKKINFPKKV